MKEKYHTTTRYLKSNRKTTETERQARRIYHVYMTDHISLLDTGTCKKVAGFS